MKEEDKERIEKCEAGCKLFTGGEVRHHKDCIFYPESFSELYDELKKSFSQGKTEGFNEGIETAAKHAAFMLRFDIGIEAIDFLIKEIQKLKKIV